MMGKHVVRYRNGLMAWNPSNDPEWRYRKTLDKKDRDRFDDMSEDDRRLVVQQWELDGAGFKF